MGRKTFATIGKPLKNRLNVIMTSTPGVDEPGLLEYTLATPAEILASLDARGYKEAAICGGSSVYSQFLKEGLVDEVYLTVEPVLFGSGVPLASDFSRINMKLIDTERLGDQAVLLHFEVLR
jgi:dihydrofolate reductase